MPPTQLSAVQAYLRNEDGTHQGGYTEMNRVAVTTILTILSVALSGVRVNAATVTISDSSFTAAGGSGSVPDHWVDDIVNYKLPVAPTVTLAGDMDAASRVDVLSHTITWGAQASGWIWQSTTFYTNDTYTPSVQGAISSVDIQVDHRGGQSGNGAPMYFAVRQDGTVFRTAGNHTTDHAPPGSSWRTRVNIQGGSALTESSFVQVVTDGSSGNGTIASSHPDFSATGGEIQFGMLVWNGSSGGNTSGGTSYNYYDNFGVTVTYGVAPPYRIVTFGDSTTAPRNVGAALNGRPAGTSSYGANDAGNSVTMVDETSGKLYVYTDQIRDALPTYLTNDTITVDNEGIGGNRTDQGLSRLNSDVRSKNPDLVVIQFGINDSAHDGGAGTPSRVALDYAEQYGPDGVPGGGDDHPNAGRGNYTSNLTDIVSTLLGDGVDVIVMTPNRVNDYSAVTESRLSLYAQVARDVAAAQGVPLIDVWARYTQYMADTGVKGNLLLDGVHPNGDGQKLVAQLLIRGIQKANGYAVSLGRPTLMVVM